MAIKFPWEEGVNFRYWSKRMISNIESFAIEKKDISLQLELSKLLVLRKSESVALKEIRKLSQKEQYKMRVQYLMSIKGIGLLTSMLLLTELVTIDRFKSLDQLASYVGLIPKMRSSGDRDKHLGLVNRCHKLIRTNMIQAAWTSLRYSPEMALYYENCRQRMKGQKAIVKVARKILNRVRYVLLNQIELKKEFSTLQHS